MNDFLVYGRVFRRFVSWYCSTALVLLTILFFAFSINRGQWAMGTTSAPVGVVFLIGCALVAIVGMKVWDVYHESMTEAEATIEEMR
jgi:hypothetical protein